MGVKEAMKSYNDWPNDKGFNSNYVENNPVELKIKGEIPPWAAGTLYRTGTGVSEIETTKNKTFKVNHFFDSMAVVHRFQILAPESDKSSVRVLYNSRSTCDGLIEQIKKTGNRDSISFAAKYDPCMSYFKKIMTVFNPVYREKNPDERSMSISMSVNFPGLESPRNGNASYQEKTGIRTLCNKTDNSDFQLLDPESLEPIGLAAQNVLHPDLKGPLSCTHAKSDPETGDVYNYNLEFGRNSTYRVFHVSASTGKTSILATITNAQPAYIHSFFLTENYVVLCVWNSFFTYGGMSILWKRNVVDALADYDPSRPARWYVIDRRTPAEGGKGVLSVYESDPFFCFHTVNAYEVPSKEGTVDIVADLVAYPNLDCLKRFFIANLVSTNPDAAAWADPSNTSWRPLIKRFRVPSVPSPRADASTQSTAQEQPKKLSLEFVSKELDAPELPTLNPVYVTRPHRYIYGVMDRGETAFFGGLMKFDMLTHEKKVWSVHGHSAGEPIFVPRTREILPGGEDDGVLLSVVLDGPVGKSYLLVLDARTMVEVGRAEIDGALGFGLHGTHVSAFGGKHIAGEKGRGLDF